MKVIVAKTAGFCFGVKKAVDKVYEQIEKQKTGRIYTFGPIIHNEQVVADLEEKGVKVIDTDEELKKLDEGTIIIRSHGASKYIYDIIEKKHLNLVDATCPFVLKIHKVVEEASSNNRKIIIVGNETHPEVLGIRGWSNSETIVISNEDEAQKLELSKEDHVTVVSQTTFNYNKFNKLVEIISKKCYDIIVVNTICNATHERQIEAREVARDVDSMIVIGGSNSSNTQKLYEICKEECKNTYYIQTCRDLDMCKLQSSSCVGITAGASTPNKIIEEVQANVRIKF